MSSDAAPATPEALDLAAAPRRAADVAAVEIEGETVVYHERTGELHLLNPTATIVWQCLDGDVTLGALADELAEATGADPAELREQLLTTVNQFADLHLLAHDPESDDARGDVPTDPPTDQPDDGEAQVVQVPGST